tara:strand:+ start:114 stop:551 length:438 start_codon:yes stop_codon:yes gene_type:complete
MRLIIIRFAIILVANLGLITYANAHQTRHVPCMVDVIYGDDNTGVVSSFVLKLQHKNQTGRKINGVSVLIRNIEGEIIRNSDANCTITSDGIDVGDTGQCEKVLQTITGKMMQSIGYDVWIKLIDEQKTDLQRADSCEVIGVRFS